MLRICSRRFEHFRIQIIDQGEYDAQHCFDGVKAAEGKKLSVEDREAHRQTIRDHHKTGHETMEMVVKEALLTMRSAVVNNSTVQARFFRKLCRVQEHIEEATDRFEAELQAAETRNQEVAQQAEEENEEAKQAAAKAKEDEPAPVEPVVEPLPELQSDGIVIRGAELICEILRGNKALCSQVSESLVGTFARLLNISTASHHVGIFVEFFTIIARPDADAPAIERNQLMVLQVPNNGLVPLDGVFQIITCLCRVPNNNVSFFNLAILHCTFQRR